MKDSKAAPSHSEVILSHYRKEATEEKASATSTMRDQITRASEVEAVRSVVTYLTKSPNPVKSLLDIGCGNGYLLSLLREEYPELDLEGLDYTPEMIDIARARDIARCNIGLGDVRELPFNDSAWDLVVTERCIINVMDRDEQVKSFSEVARVLKRGGHFLCIEGFTDGLDQLNEARAELGLPPNVQPHHNLWFDKDWFLETIGKEFEVVDTQAVSEELPPPNFLSSHYFISRALYPAVTSTDIIYNTHLVKFFSFLPPMGFYSPIQLYLLRKR
jgi:ubiquinone/menaquinone biosynthesis C-methylase UbiE